MTRSRRKSAAPDRVRIIPVRHTYDRHSERGAADGSASRPQTSRGRYARGGQLKGSPEAGGRGGREGVYRDDTARADARTYPFHDFYGSYARHPFHSRRKGGQSYPSPLASLRGSGGDSQQFDGSVPQAVGGDLVVAEPHREHPRTRALHAGEPYERARKMVRERAERSAAKKRGR